MVFWSQTINSTFFITVTAILGLTAIWQRIFTNISGYAVYITKSRYYSLLVLLVIILFTLNQEHTLTSNKYTLPIGNRMLSLLYIINMILAVIIMSYSSKIKAIFSEYLFCHLIKNKTGQLHI